MDSSNPKLSVIIPVDGTEEYFPKCIDSITNQTLRNIEIIVVNDCSTGNINSLIERFRKDKRIKYINLKSKKGLGGARNEGIRQAKGKYVTHCDSDDWVDLSLYEEVTNSLENTNADIGTCSLYREYSDRPEGLFKCYYDKEYVLDGLTAFKIFTFQYQFEVDIVGQVTNKVYRREFIEAKRLKFIEKAFYEDLEYNFKALHQANRVVCVPSVRYHHLKRAKSIVQSISRKHIADFFFSFGQIKKYRDANDPNNELMWNYYAFAERYYNLIVRQIFEFELNDEARKDLLKYSFAMLPDIVSLEEFIKYSDVEKIRRHLQPYIVDTIIK